MMANRLGWIGNILFIIGAIFIARSPDTVCLGLLCNCLANIIYILVGTMSRLPSLTILSISLGTISAYGIYVRLEG